MHPTITNGLSIITEKSLCLRTNPECCRIASGKGGTGKTTVATSLAVSLGSGVRLLDRDVENTNAHLFM